MATVVMMTTFARGSSTIKALRESRELIFLSEHIAVSPGVNEADPIAGLFYVCLPARDLSRHQAAPPTGRNHPCGE